MANVIVDDSKRDSDEDNITKRLNKAFESRLDLDRVCWRQKITLLIRFDSICNSVRNFLNSINSGNIGSAQWFVDIFHGEYIADASKFA